MFHKNPDTVLMKPPHKVYGPSNLNSLFSHKSSASLPATRQFAKMEGGNPDKIYISPLSDWYTV